MNKVRFAKDEGSIFYKELRQKVDEYFSSQKIAKTGNRKMYFKIVMYFSMDILFYILMMQSESIFSFYLFYILTGLSVLLTAFNISHDAAHGVAVRKKSLNNFLFQLSFNLQGNNAYVWGKNHTESHHLYTNIEGSDIDVLNNPLVRMTDTQPIRWFHRFQHIYVPFLYLLYSLNWFLFRESLMLINYSSRTIKIVIPRREVFKLVFFKLFYIFYMIVIPALLLPFGWGPVLLAFLMNHLMVGLIFTGVLGVSHLSDYVTHPNAAEDGTLDMSWPKLQMLTSIDYNANSQFLNWTLGGFNAHALHHLLPDVCHVHYPAILPILREVADRHGLTYMEMPYSKALASHFRFLKSMGNSKKLHTRVYEG
jgi:linoleoyl-CoA desaturase